MLLILLCIGPLVSGGISLLAKPNPDSVTGLICWGCPCFLFACVLVLKVVLMLLHPPGWATLSLTDRALIYFPGFLRADTTSTWKLLFKRSPRIINRGAIDAITLERVGERQRLTVDVGADRIEFGSYLKEPEREWLATVLRLWAGFDDDKLPDLREPPSTNIKPAP
jgi:hypothetical protein